MRDVMLLVIKRLLLAAAIVLVSGNVLAHDKFSIPAEEALGLDPETAAIQAIARGDLSLLMVADCFMGVEGYVGSGPPQIRPKVLGKTCDELEGSAGASMRSRLKEWAAKYNQVIQQHNNALEPAR